MQAALEPLSDVPFLQSLSPSERADIQHLLIAREYQVGTEVFKQGDVGDSLFIIRKGRVKFEFRYDTGASGHFEVVGPGVFFGEVAAFSLDRTRTATAKVLEALDAWELPREGLMELMKRHPEAALELLTGMAERLSRSGLKLQHSPVRNLNAVNESDLKPRERLARVVAGAVGHPIFVGIHLLVFASWIAYNASRGTAGFDPYPFHFLGILVGLEALILSSFVLMNQYREDREMAHRNDEEFKINANAEAEIHHLHERLDEIRDSLKALSPGK